MSHPIVLLPSMENQRNDEQYRNMVKRIRGASLLALPQSAAKILELSRDDQSGPPEFAAAVSADLGLTTQILRFVNSSYFGFRNRITTIQLALSLVYGRTIKNFILWNAVFAMLPNPRCGPFELKKICQDALRRGIFAKLFGSHVPGQDPDELFLCALFQDMALPILAQTWPTEYSEILTRREKERWRLSDLENDLFGWNHADAGAFLVDEWGFTDGLNEAIVEHIRAPGDIDIKACEPRQLRNAIVTMTGFLPSVVDDTWHEADDFFALYSQLAAPGMPLPHELFEQVESHLPELAAISRLGLVGNTLTEFHKQWLATFE